MHQGISTAVDKVSLGNSSVGKSLPTPCFTKVCTLWVLSSYISTSVSNRYVSLFVFMTLCLRVSPVRLAEYRWRPLFNAAKFGWRPLYQMPCQDAKPVEIYRGAPNSGTDLSRSSPYYDDMWRRYCSLTSFFPIVDTCISCEDTARQSCAMVPRDGDYWRTLRPVFPLVIR